MEQRNLMNWSNQEMENGGQVLVSSTLSLWILGQCWILLISEVILKLLENEFGNISKNFFQKLLIYSGDHKVFFTKITKESHFLLNINPIPIWRFFHYRFLDSSILRNHCDNYMPQWWVEFDDELSWLFTNRLSATKYMKVKRMGITEILRRIWLFSANKIKSSESGSK